MAVDFNAMSDEEFERHMHSLPVEEESETIEDTTSEEAEEEVIDTEGDTQDTDETTEETEDETESQTTDSDEKEEESTEDTDQEENTPTEETTEIDYKAFYEQVTSDYKANGKVMPGLKSPEDFKAALAMASNYALKTTAIKPHLGRIKMLKDVTDEELNEMLDFRNRNPEVIKKALKEAGIDPLDIDPDAKVEYRANDYTISQAEIEFDEVISEIRDTPEFAMTSKVVTEVWDAESKKIMLENPHLIKGLNEEIQIGRFDKIQAMIEQRKLLGRTNGMSDLAMYQEIATAMNEAQAQTQVASTPKPAPKPKVEDPAVKAEKQKAGISVKKTSTAVKKYDPTKLSDEEFMKLVESGAKFI